MASEECAYTRSEIEGTAEWIDKLEPTPAAGRAPGYGEQGEDISGELRIADAAFQRRPYECQMTRTEIGPWTKFICRQCRFQVDL